jgi:hypothetical protein
MRCTLFGPLSKVSTVASVQCSSPAMAAKRVELAAKIDRGEPTEQQARLATNKAYATVQEAERRRSGLPLPTLARSVLHIGTPLDLMSVRECRLGWVLVIISDWLSR